MVYTPFNLPIDLLDQCFGLSTAIFVRGVEMVGLGGADGVAIDRGRSLVSMRTRIDRLFVDRYDHR